MAKLIQHVYPDEILPTIVEAADVADRGAVWRLQPGASDSFVEPTRAQLYAVAHVIDGQRFMTIRVQARLSQRAVARAAGVTLPVVRGAEEGRSQQMTLALVTR